MRLNPLDTVKAFGAFVRTAFQGALRPVLVIAVACAAAFATRIVAEEVLLIMLTKRMPSVEVRSNGKIYVYHMIAVPNTGVIPAWQSQRSVDAACCIVFASVCAAGWFLVCRPRRRERP